MDSQLPKRARSGDSSSCFSSPVDAADLLLERLLEFPSSSVGNSIEKLMDYRISQSKEDVVERAFQLGSTLVEASSRYARMLACKHNAESWTLPRDMTAKVFSMLDTQSLCCIASTCSVLNKCASHPSCYTNIDLTSAAWKANDAVLRTMVQRAGKYFESLKLGTLQVKKKARNRRDSILSWSCLDCLITGDGLAGSLLRSLHLYHINSMDSPTLCKSLLAFPSLRDLEVIGMDIELREIVESIYYCCYLVERIVLESSNMSESRRFEGSLKSIHCTNFVNCCPNLASLSLRGFKLRDHQARILMEGFRKLKFVDFSASYLITGSFLRNLGGLNLLEDLILRDCSHLMEVEVSGLLAGLLTGDFKSLRTLDVSNKDGLATDGGHLRCYSMKDFLVKQVEEERPGLVIHADFPVDQSREDINGRVYHREVDACSDPFAPASSSSEGELYSEEEEVKCMTFSEFFQKYPRRR